MMMREMKCCLLVWAFYYLLSGLCRKLGEMYAASLSGSSATSFQTLLDIGGDVCRLLVWAFYYQLSDLAG